MNMQKVYNEVDMLKGNINRMCVTDDKEELFKMYDFACLRLNRIYELNNEKLRERYEVNYISDGGGAQ